MEVAQVEATEPEIGQDSENESRTRYPYTTFSRPYELSQLIELRASVLNRTLNFFTWPSDVGKSISEEGLRIGVLGESEIRGAWAVEWHLKSVRRAMAVELYPLIIKRSDDVSQLLDSHLIYIDSKRLLEKEPTELKALLLMLREKSILTVGPTPPFVINGGACAIYAHETKAKVLLNTTVFAELDVSVDEKLLKNLELYTE